MKADWARLEAREAAEADAAALREQLAKAEVRAREADEMSGFSGCGVRSVRGSPQDIDLVKLWCEQASTLPYLRDRIKAEQTRATAAEQERDIAREDAAGWRETHRFCEQQWQEERGVMLDKLAAEREECARLREALAAAVPLLDHIAGQDMTLTRPDGATTCAIKAAEAAADALGVEIGMSEWVELVLTGKPPARSALSRTTGAQDGDL